LECLNIDGQSGIFLVRAASFALLALLLLPLALVVFVNALNGQNFAQSYKLLNLFGRLALGLGGTLRLF
jgi:hypothetical protein